MKKYTFNEAIEEKLNQFEKYLQSKKYAKATIRQTRNYAGIYLEKLEGVDPKIVDYKLLTDFIFQLKKENTERKLSRIILAVRHYYDSLKVEKNPAAGLVIKSRSRGSLNEIIDYKILPQVYENHPTKSDREKRNKVILGLYVYQAITTGGLQKLEPKHIKLKEGKIHLSANGQTASRVLELKAAQLLGLQEYLLIVRPRMLENVKKNRPGRKPKTLNSIIYERLFFSESGGADIKNSVLNLFRAVRKNYPEVKNGKLIRATVIAQWLKSKDLRIVQYMAGHRWVSSTEKYNAHNLEELQESLNKHHPLSKSTRQI